MKYKRKITFLLVVLLLFSLFTASCGDLEQEQNAKRVLLNGFSVHYLDVGNGDCIFIKFLDGKTALIDSAEPDDQKAEYISDFLKDYGTTKLDYFIITHPDADHIGNAHYLIKEFDVKNLYIPDLNARAIEYFPILEQVISLANEREINIKKSDNYKVILGDGYSMAFLTPYPKGFSDSSYNDVNGELIPDQAQVNNLSPIIYLESCGFRFVFTGDAGSSQEKLALKIVNDPIFRAQMQMYKINVDLCDVDFLKLGHHGSDSSSCMQFLQTLKPKNAVVSVSGNNYYGHPNTEVLERLSTVNPEYKLYRTDVHGTVSVGVVDGEIKIITDKID